MILPSAISLTSKLKNKLSFQLRSSKQFKCFEAVNISRYISICESITNEPFLDIYFGPQKVDIVFLIRQRK
jgi:hypothetical protein